jgi:hypothetical protein
METADLVQLLFDRLNPAQQLRFKQAIVVQTIYLFIMYRNAYHQQS